MGDRSIFLREDGNLTWWAAVLFLPLQIVFWLLFQAIPGLLQWLWDKITGEKD